MREMTFSDFKTGVIESRKFEGQENCRTLMDTIAEFIVDDDIVEFYPKGLFVSENIEALVFKKDSVFSFVTNGKHSVIKSLKYRDLVSIELTQSESDDRKKLIEMKFSVDSISLQSDVDTNEHWSRKFAEKISNIFKLIS